MNTMILFKLLNNSLSGIKIKLIIFHIFKYANSLYYVFEVSEIILKVVLEYKFRENVKWKIALGQKKHI